MNCLRGTIQSVKTEGLLSLVEISMGGFSLKSIVIETPQTVAYLREGGHINLLFKETEVIIGKGPSGALSLQNKVDCNVIKITKGDLLSKIILNDGSNEIASIITTDAVEQLGLCEGDAVVAMIKTNEILLAP